MRWKFVLATLFLVAGVPVFSQSDPAAIMSSLQVNAGFGLSAYRDDFEGPGIMEGSTLWFDVYPHRGPKLLEGFGVDIEVRDIDFGRPPTQPSNLREVTGGGGLIYSWRHFHNLNPYGKVDWEVAGIDFHAGNPRYNYDTRNLSAYGLGIEYRIVQHISVRAGYEEQFWQRLFQDHAISTPTGIALKPRGVTVGAFYEFDRIHMRWPVQEK